MDLSREIKLARIDNLLLNITEEYIPRLHVDGNEGPDDHRDYWFRDGDIGVWGTGTWDFTGYKRLFVICKSEKAGMNLLSNTGIRHNKKTISFITEVRKLRGRSNFIYIFAGDPELISNSVLRELDRKVHFNLAERVFVNNQLELLYYLKDLKLKHLEAR